MQFRNDNKIKNFSSRVKQVPENFLNSEFFGGNLLFAIRNYFYILDDYEKTSHYDIKLPMNIVRIEDIFNNFALREKFLNTFYI